MKNALEGFNSRLDEDEEWISKQKTKQWNSPRQSNKMKKKKKSEDNLRACGGN